MFLSRTTRRTLLLTASLVAGVYSTTAWVTPWAVAAADCISPPPPAVPTPGQVPDARMLAVTAADLEGSWCLVSAGDDYGYKAQFRNVADYASPREVNLRVMLMPDTAKADMGVRLMIMPSYGVHYLVHALRQGSEIAHMAQPPAQGEGVPEPASWELGDGLVFRSVVNAGRFAAAQYAFRIDRALALVEVRGQPGEEADLDMQALGLARLQEARMWAMLGTKPTLPPGLAFVVVPAGLSGGAALWLAVRSPRSPITSRLRAFWRLRTL